MLNLAHAVRLIDIINISGGVSWPWRVPPPSSLFSFHCATRELGI